MNKSAGVLVGIVVAVGAISAGGAWYTGTKLEGVLQTSVQEANKELQAAMIGSNGTANLELVSLERGTFSSVARYRLKGQGEMFGDAAEGVELLFTDRIEHGPLPFSRLVTLKWLPVMATSHYSLEKTPFTEKWFAATHDASPVKGVVNLGYDRSASGNVELLPLELALDEQSTLKFSGLNMELAVAAEAQKLKANGYMDSLTVATVAEDQTPVLMELNGLTLASDLAKGSFGYYLGQNNLELKEAKTTFGPQQAVLSLKKFEARSSTEESGSNAAGRAVYTIGDVAYNGKTLGSANMAWGIKNLDIPATLSLMQVYQTKLQPYEEAAAAAEAAGEPAPQLQLNEAEQAQVKAGLEKLLAAKPQVALENLSFKTANGESRFNLAMDFAAPASFDLPPDQLSKQVVTEVKSKLSLSKPMIGDLATLQALLDGQTDAQAIAMQSGQAGEMVGMMAVQSGLATVQGDDVVSSLHYADGMVDFNGQKMTVEEFAMLMAAHLAALSPRG